MAVENFAQHLHSPNHPYHPLDNVQCTCIELLKLKTEQPKDYVVTTEEKNVKASSHEKVGGSSLEAPTPSPPRNPKHPSLGRAKSMTNQETAVPSSFSKTQMSNYLNRQQAPWCLDDHSYCGYWASIGECSKNPGYMLTYCRVSCGTCY